MPTLHSATLPLPKNWQDFETMVCDAQMQRWRGSTLQKNGRPGQKQSGVDIFGPDEIGRPIAIQCKCYRGPLKLAQIEKEISNAEKYKGKLTTLFIATTADYDAELQKEVRLLSDKRVAQSEFAVTILFWDHIVGGLLLNPAVAHAHYPQITIPSASNFNKDRLIAALELGYFGADIWQYLILIFGELGQMTQTDPDELIANLGRVSRRTQQVLSQSDAAPILTAIDEIRKGCLSNKSKKSDWDIVETYSERIRKRLDVARSSLPLIEASVLELGLQLGRIYFVYDEVPPVALRQSIKSRIFSVLSPKSVSRINKGFADAKKLSGSKWARRIYSLLEREITSAK